MILILSSGNGADDCDDGDDVDDDDDDDDDGDQSDQFGTTQQLDCLVCTPDTASESESDLQKNLFFSMQTCFCGEVGFKIWLKYT